MIEGDKRADELPIDKLLPPPIDIRNSIGIITMLPAFKNFREQQNNLNILS